jgi:hypothetical protein
MCEQSGASSSTSMSSAADSPARTSALPAAGLALTASVQDSGFTSTDSLASYDPATSSWKTSQRSLLAEWDESLETWPRAGLMRSGTAYPRQPLAPLTRETESGLWRTPQAGEGNGGGQEASKRQQGGHSVYLRDQVKTWPTPRAEYDSGRHRGKPDTLHSAVKRWPTPRSCSAMSAEFTEAALVKASERFPNLESVVAQTDPIVGGSLNPTWVEWLMGYPLGWTVCEGWGTRSSRKSRSGSPNASTKRKG